MRVLVSARVFSFFLGEGGMEWWGDGEEWDGDGEGEMAGEKI